MLSITDHLKELKVGQTHAELDECDSKKNKNHTSGLHHSHHRSTLSLSKICYSQHKVYTPKLKKNTAKLSHILCLSVCGPMSQTRCQFVFLISMFSAVLTDGETLGWLSSKRCNKQNLGSLKQHLH